MSEDIAVIVPFFQKEQGVLLKAIKSVCAQDVDINILLLVIDDGSPITAQDELINFKFPDNIVCEVHEQKNSGPASARNFGLKISQDKEIHHVSFLDSDDEWEINHLSNALVCLHQGYDFYFSNYIQLGATNSVFERAKFDVDSCKAINKVNKLYEFNGDMFDQILRNCLIGTPTVVFNTKKLKGVFFNEAYKSAREDTIYWLEVAARKATFCFSDNIELICGSGVNIWARSEWGSLKRIDQLLHYLKYSFFVKKQYDLTQHQTSFINNEIAKNRYQLIECILHRVIQRKKMPVSLLRTFTKLDFLGVIFSPFIVAKLFFLKLSQRS